MKSMAANKLKITRRLSAIMILLCWLFMFLFPAITFNFCLNWLFDITYEANRRSASSELINEMNLFKHDATTLSYLDGNLENLFSLEGRRIGNLSASETIDFIKEKSNLQIACLVKHDKDTEHLDIEIAPHVEKYLKVLPRRITRRSLISLNRQYEHSFYADKNQKSVDSLIRKEGVQKLAMDSEIFLKKQFALIADVPLVPDKAVKSISGRLRGPVYFYYHPFVEIIKGQKFIRGGVMLVVLGRDLSMRAVLESAINSKNKKLTRGFSTLPFAIGKKFSNNDSIITTFSSDNSAYFLTSTLSHKASIDLIQRGTIYPFKIDQTAKNLPLLKVSIPHAKFQHPMHVYLPLIIFFLKLFTVGGAIFLLHLYFFGMEFKSGIRQKILVGIGLIMILPLTLLVVSIGTWSEFNRLETINAIETQLTTQLESVQQKFNDYLISVQQYSFRVASSMGKLSKTKDKAFIEEKLSEVLEQTNASAILFDQRKKGRILLSKTNATGVEKNEEDLMKMTSRAVLNVFSDSGKFEIEYIPGEKESFSTVNPNFMNEILNSWGRLFLYDRFRTGNRTSWTPILQKDSLIPAGLVVTKFRQEDLIQGFLKSAYKQGNWPDEKIMKLDFYMVRDSGRGRSFFNCFAQKNVENRNLANILEMATNGNSFRFSDSQGRQCYVRHYIDFPFIVVARSQVIIQAHKRSYSFLLLLAFSLLLISFAYMVFGEIYLKPIAKFIGVTERVFLGDYTAKVELQTGDEFGELKNAFDSMIEGLDQKEKMSRFVSQDVINAVEANTDDKMAPGGEKVEATVAFVQLVSLAELREPQEIMDLLSLFIEVTDDCAQKWGGVIDKVIEDTLMLVFRSNHLSENHAISASGAVLEIGERLKVEGLKVNSGLASGIVVSGRIGSRLGKLDYTVIGDAVNLAARLKVEAKKAGETGIIIAPSSVRKLKGLAKVAFIERIPIKGKSREYPLYELLSLRKV